MAVKNVVNALQALVDFFAVFALDALFLSFGLETFLALGMSVWTSDSVPTASQPFLMFSAMRESAIC